MKIRISTPIYPTEDENKILETLKELFPEVDFKKISKPSGEHYIIGESHNFNCLKIVISKLTERGVLPTLRFLLEKNKFLKKSFFELNKQVAMLKKVHLVEEENPLGNIKIEIEGVDELLQALH